MSRSAPEVVAPAVTTDEVCRTCGGEVTLGTSLLLPQHRHLVKWVERNLALQVNEENGLPHRVCIRCLDHIQDWISFYSKCKLVQGTLTKKDLSEPTSTKEDRSPLDNRSKNKIPPISLEIPEEDDSSLSSNEASNNSSRKLRKQPSRQSKRHNNDISNDLFSYDAILDEILRSDEDSESQTTKIRNKIPKLRKKRSPSHTKQLSTTNKSKSPTNNESLKSNSQVQTKSSLASNTSVSQFEVINLGQNFLPVNVTSDISPINALKVPVITKNPNLIKITSKLPENVPLVKIAQNVQNSMSENFKSDNRNPLDSIDCPLNLSLRPPLPYIPSAPLKINVIPALIGHAHTITSPALHNTIIDELLQ